MPSDIKELIPRKLTNSKCKLYTKFHTVQYLRGLDQILVNLRLKCYTKFPLFDSPQEQPIPFSIHFERLPFSFLIKTKHYIFSLLNLDMVKYIKRRQWWGCADTRSNNSVVIMAVMHDSDSMFIKTPLRYSSNINESRTINVILLQII